MSYSKPLLLSDISEHVRTYFKSIYVDTLDLKGLNYVVQNSFNNAQDNHEQIILDYINEIPKLNCDFIHDKGIDDPTLYRLLKSDEFASKESWRKAIDSVNERIQDLENLIKTGSKIRKLKHRVFRKVIGFENYDLEIQLHGFLPLLDKNYDVDSISDLINIIDKLSREKIKELNLLKANYKCVSPETLKQRYVDSEKAAILRAEKKASEDAKEITPPPRFPEVPIVPKTSRNSNDSNMR